MEQLIAELLIDVLLTWISDVHSYTRDVATCNRLCISIKTNLTKYCVWLTVTSVDVWYFRLTISPRPMKSYVCQPCGYVFVM